MHASADADSTTPRRFLRPIRATLTATTLVAIFACSQHSPDPGASPGSNQPHQLPRGIADTSTARSRSKKAVDEARIVIADGDSAAKVDHCTTVTAKIDREQWHGIPATDPGTLTAEEVAQVLLYDLNDEHGHQMLRQGPSGTTNRFLFLVFGGLGPEQAELIKERPGMVAAAKKDANSNRAILDRMARMDAWTRPNTCDSPERKPLGTCSIGSKEIAALTWGIEIKRYARTKHAADACRSLGGTWSE